MDKVRLAICDDEEVSLEDIRQFLAVYINETRRDMIIDSYFSGMDLLNALKEEKSGYDIFILDVDMPDICGTEVAKELRRMYPMAVICFITAYEEYAYEAYQADALGYLTKPVNYDNLQHLLDRCFIQIEYCRDFTAAKEKYLELKTQQGMVLLDIKEIMYIEKRRNQCIFHLNEKDVVSYMSLADAYKMLNPEMFYYVHQGFIVNFAQIREIKSNVVCFGEGREIPISRRYQSKMRAMHMDKIKNLRAERQFEKLA